MKKTYEIFFSSLGSVRYASNNNLTVKLTVVGSNCDVKLRGLPGCTYSVMGFVSMAGLRGCDIVGSVAPIGFQGYGVNAVSCSFHRSSLSLEKRGKTAECGRYVM